MSQTNRQLDSDGRDRSGAEYWDKRSRPEIHSSESPLMTAVRHFDGHKYDRMVSRMLSHAPREGSLLELGCAPGWFLARVHRLRPDLRLSGIDYAPLSAKNTRDYLDSAGVDAAVEEADLRTFTPAEPVDVVISSGLLEHFDDPAQIVSHHARIAGPGGWVLISVPNFRTWTLRRGFESLAPEDFATHNLAVMNRTTLASLLQDCGLEDVSSGWAGGSTLYATPRQRPTGIKLAYMMAARVWNLLAAIWPDALSPWHGYYWAVGRVPK